MNDSCNSLKKILNFELCLLFDMLLEPPCLQSVYARAYAEELQDGLQKVADTDIDGWLELLFWQQRLEGAVERLELPALLKKFMPCAKLCLEAHLQQLLKAQQQPAPRYGLRA